MVVKICRRKGQWIVSKAFIKSAFIMHLGLILLHWYPFTSSFARRTLSPIDRPLIKAVWFKDIKSGKICYNRFARTLMMHLYITLQQEIGRDSIIKEALGTLGTRIVRVLFASFKSFELVKKIWRAETKLGPTILQAIWRNRMYNHQGLENCYTHI